MIKEALEYLHGLADRSKHAVVEMNDEERLVVFADGEKQVVDIRAARRNHQLHTITDMAEAVKRWGEDGVVFVDLQRVVLLMDDDCRRDRATLTFEQTAVANFLSKDLHRLTQKQFLWVLRTTLRDAVDDSLELLIRSVRVSRLTEARQSRVEQSLGRQVAAAVGDDDEIPDSFEVFAPLYVNEGADDPVKIQCRLEFDFDEERFCIVPDSDGLHQRRVEVSRDFAEALHELAPGAPLFLGRP